MPPTDIQFLREAYGVRLERAIWRGQTAFVKTLTGPTPERAARFEREGQIAASLHHPNIVELLDHQPGQLMYRWIEGESLRDRLERGPLSETRALYLVQTVLEALEYAHAQGVSHLDLKPENIVLDGEKIYLTDFGQAHTDHLTRLTGPGERLGTPQYMAPEQFHGQRSDPRSDLYAVSVLLYECLTGELPFPDALTWLMGRGPELELSAVPMRLRPLLQAGLSREPANRPDSARTYLNVLATLQVSV